jgi:predicted RNA binding protein YcfA (HicA-like mRNA interferase family)
VKFGAFIDVLAAHGSVLHRHGSGSHAIYRGVVERSVRLVTIAAHRMGDEIAPGTFASMIRQTGLPKHVFRNRR